MTLTYNRLHIYILKLTLLIIAAMLSACSDEIDYEPGSVPEGLPTELTLRLNLVEAADVSRAMADDEVTTRVHSLWIAMFNTDGKCTFKKLFKEGDSGFNAATEMYPTTYNITLTCLSGHQNIVAVANPVNNYGVWNYGVGTKTVQRLDDILSHVESLDDYLDISTVLTEPTMVERISANFPMSGVYHISRTAPPSRFYDDEGKPSGWADIPSGKTTLTGCIYLRRQESYTKFNIISDPNITVTPMTWQVFNLPSLSFLSERFGNSGSTSTALKELEHYNYSNYNISLEQREFKSGELTTATGKAVTVGKDAAGNLSTSAPGGTQAKGLSFDFYSFGNKHTALDWVKSYNDREKEYKDADGRNTGIFSSLVADPADKDDDNNNATYVVIKAQLDYYVDADNRPVAEGTASAVRRSAIATFTVHMGYCEGETEEEKARDFNIRRNTKYTYNIIVNGVDNIRVEALKANGEPQPGLEGDVSDAGAIYIELDAHYSQFNIKLSNEERLNLSYQIQTPFHNTVWDYSSNDGGLKAPTGKEQFVDWVEFRPGIYDSSKDKDYMATYTGTHVEDKAWKLYELGNPREYPGLMDCTSSDADLVEDKMPTDVTSKEYQEWLAREHYYTMFINEYVYTRDLDGKSMLVDGKNSKWYYFANKPNRTIWLMNEDNRQVSTDGNSTYIRAKYIVSQKSIQTYYNTTGTTAEMAIGVEHTNETLGLNLEWKASHPNGWNKDENCGGWNKENGRQNMATYFKATTNNQTQWNEIRVNETYGGRIFLEEEIVPGINHPEAPYYMSPEDKPAYTFALKGRTYTPNVYDANPSDNRSFEPMAICMGRNRDLNGNHVIDPEELRWVLPTYATYGRIIAGASSLPDPLINYSTAISQMPYSYWPDNQNNSLYHFISSNGWYIWGEEGLSVTKSNPAGQTRHFWNIRCIRNLGNNPKNLLEKNPVPVAYHIDSVKNMVTMTYYDQRNLHSPTSAPIEIHHINERGNTMAYQWEYKTESIQISTGLNTNDKMINEIEKNPCDKYNINGEIGWRVPNQKELTILFNMTNSDKVNDSFHVSCSQEFYLMGGKKGTDPVPIFYRFMGTNGGVVTAFSTANYEDNTNKYVRCVRDVVNTTRQ